MKIGDKIFGGVIFKLDETGEHGLVCSTKVIGRKPWGECKKLCENYKVKEGDITYIDWYMPDIETLIEIHDAQVFLYMQWRKTGVKPSINYEGTIWSSTQVSKTAFNDLWFNRTDVRKPGKTGPQEIAGAVSVRKF